MFKKIFSDQSKGFWRFHGETELLACEMVSQAIEQIAFIKHFIGAKNILVLSDQGVKTTGVIDELFVGQGVNFSLLETECEHAPIVEAIENGKRSKSDLVIAVGGGSVLDAAKLVAAAIPNNLMPEELWEVNKLSFPPIVLIAIPTTFGTGSECNMTAHLSIDNAKRSLDREWLTPDYALLIAEIAQSVPDRLRYLSALDAWLHAVEALTLRNEVSPVQQGVLKEAIQLLDQHFVPYINTPDKENSLAIASASSMAGLGLNNSRTGLIHALATPFAKYSGLSHAESLLPFIIPSFRYNWQKIASFFRDESLVIFEQRIKTSYLSGAQGIMDAWSFTIKSSDVDTMAKACLDDTVLLKENPVSIGPGDYVNLYKIALEKWLV